MDEYKEYTVVYTCIYGDTVEARSPKEAAEIVAGKCPYDIDGSACVTCVNTDEEWEI